MTLQQERKIDKLIRLLEQAQGTPLLKNAEWGTHEDAVKILPKSKSWYQKRRLNRDLVKGADWRTVGKTIEYNLASVERLKEELINVSA